MEKIFLLSFEYIFIRSNNVKFTAAAKSSKQQKAFKTALSSLCISRRSFFPSEIAFQNGNGSIDGTNLALPFKFRMIKIQHELKTKNRKCVYLGDPKGRRKSKLGI